VTVPQNSFKSPAQGLAVCPGAGSAARRITMKAPARTAGTAKITRFIFRSSFVMAIAAAIVPHPPKYFDLNTDIKRTSTAI
jgi:hypothetical protein